MAYDRFLSTQLGAHAAKLIKDGKFGYTVAVKGGLISENPLKDIAGKTKFIDPNSQVIEHARNIGISFGD